MRTTQFFSWMSLGQILLLCSSSLADGPVSCREECRKRSAVSLTWRVKRDQEAASISELYKFLNDDLNACPNACNNQTSVEDCKACAEEAISDEKLEQEKSTMAAFVCADDAPDNQCVKQRMILFDKFADATEKAKAKAEADAEAAKAKADADAQAAQEAQAKAAADAEAAKVQAAADAEAAKAKAEADAEAAKTKAAADADAAKTKAEADAKAKADADAQAAKAKADADAQAAKAKADADAQAAKAKADADAKQVQDRADAYAKSLEAARSRDSGPGPCSKECQQRCAIGDLLMNGQGAQVDAGANRMEAIFKDNIKNCRNTCVNETPDSCATCAEATITDAKLAQDKAELDKFACPLNAACTIVVQPVFNYTTVSNGQMLAKFKKENPGKMMIPPNASRRCLQACKARLPFNGMMIQGTEKEIAAAKDFMMSLAQEFFPACANACAGKPDAECDACALENIPDDYRQNLIDQVNEKYACGRPIEQTGGQIAAEAILGVAPAPCTAINFDIPLP